ncbi:MAG: ABC transporter ATP-binding protein [Desulfobacterales bacterium]|nr:MAG: ABC transporter ATP-binding protein [Desulfobacterales bacterium]
MNDKYATATTALDIQKVDSFYGELQVLRKASLKLHEGEVVALFGPNGHGKSTLLKVISGIHPAVSGSIKYMGAEIAKTSSQKIVELGIAYIPEARNLFPDMTVLENLRLGAYNRRARGMVGENLEYVFALFPHLEERKDQIAITLSGGESRMLAVSRGLMSGASLLLIDEPSIGLSPITKKTVFGAIEKIKNETDITVLIVEQEVDNALKLAERVYLLKRGQVFLEKVADEISKAEIEKAYF